MPSKPEEPSPSPVSFPQPEETRKPAPTKADVAADTLFGNIINLFSNKKAPDNSFRETIEEYVDIPESAELEGDASLHERWLLSNILKLRDLSVDYVMIPRADIVAIDMNTSHEELLTILKERQFSRLPVYRDTLDDVVGTVHMKDMIAAIANNKQIDIKSMLSDLPIVSPSMPILDLLLKMRQSRRHMVLVVDEYGGIDGLVTIGDIIEFIVGEIDDEHDIDIQKQIVEKPDGSILLDARLDIESFEEKFGAILSEEEREENDTLGGLVFFMAGRVPARGEVLTHQSGLVFEIVDADPRRITKLKIRNFPQTSP
jgi:CBS domain containing-hemolysin-like protein